MEPRRWSGDGGIVGHVGEPSRCLGDEGRLPQHATVHRGHLPRARRQHMGTRLSECPVWHGPMPPKHYSAAVALLPLPIKVNAIPSDLIGTTAYFSAYVANHLRHRVRPVAQQIGHQKALQD